MAKLDIRTFGDPVLRQRAREVERVTEVHLRLIANLFETMREAPGVGLAAIQVGVLERIFTWEVEDEHGVLVNPVIVERSEETQTGEEGCLSLPGLAYEVERHQAVTVEGVDERLEPVRIEAEGFKSVVLQHEIDHLDGVLYIDRLPEELRREALRQLRDVALGFGPRPVKEEAL